MNETNYVLLDSMNLIYMSFYGGGKLALKTNENMPTNAIYTFVNMLGKLQKKYSNSIFISVFESQQKSFRFELSEDYKNNRPKMPDDLIVQVPYIKKILTAFGIQQISKEGFEADDVLASIATLFSNQNKKTVIVTSDKDICQIVNDNIFIHLPSKDTLLDEVGVIEKFGIPPNRIVDYLSLLGDVSDNIKGVNGIGQKSAVELVKHFSSIDEMYSKIVLIPNLNIRGAQKIAQNLFYAKDQVYLAKQMITLKTDIAINESFFQNNVDVNLLEDIYTELNFNSLLRKLQ